MKYAARRLLGEGVSWLGIARAQWKMLPRGLYVLNYHRIGISTQTDFNRGTFSCDAVRFREHMELIKERFDVVGLERLDQLTKSGFEGDRPVAIITLDDGYLDNYEVAFPIIRDLEMCAVFFLPTAFIEAEQIPWWDEISWVVRRAGKREFILPNSTERFSLRTEDEDEVIRKVLLWVINQRTLTMSAKLDIIRNACEGPARDPAAKCKLFMSWTQAREMLDAGMDIGSHTHSHPILSHLSPHDQQTELSISKDILEDRLGPKLPSIAYPVGGHDAFTMETTDIARRLGYRFGFNYIGRHQTWPVRDLFDINRLQIDDLGVRSRLREMVTFPQFAYA